MHDKSPRVIIWTRVSTEEQTTTNQVRQLQEMCQHRGWEVIETCELTESAWKVNADRRFQRLYQLARNRKFDILLVWALDRLSRRGPLETLEIVDRFQQHQVRVISYGEGWTEVDGPALTLLLGITGWVAQQESEQRSRRTLAGLARAAEQGRRPGRPLLVQYVDWEFVRQCKEEGHGWHYIWRHHPLTTPGKNNHKRRPTESTIRLAYESYFVDLEWVAQCLDEELSQDKDWEYLHRHHRCTVPMLTGEQRPPSPRAIRLAWSLREKGDLDSIGNFLAKPTDAVVV